MKCTIETLMSHNLYATLCGRLRLSYARSHYGGERFIRCKFIYWECPDLRNVGVWLVEGLVLRFLTVAF